ncbi:hypothetical protein BLNAU_7556 [Blattamonas nauphoetae]|uniref:Ataxin-10 domain-containing protein n=1 Tax=Blattamonas nauphoetae TaxID=2049346 RepID=A0ABQ9Y0Z2_9EUKA|nr:hypothetical protein BLNAU_7556 [Blattamonas nauphoetae]
MDASQLTSLLINSVSNLEMLLNQNKTDDFVTNLHTLLPTLRSLRDSVVKIVPFHAAFEEESFYQSITQLISLIKNFITSNQIQQKLDEEEIRRILDVCAQLIGNLFMINDGSLSKSITTFLPDSDRLYLFMIFERLMSIGMKDGLSLLEISLFSLILSILHALSLSCLEQEPDIVQLDLSQFGVECALSTLLYVSLVTFPVKQGKRIIPLKTTPPLPYTSWKLHLPYPKNLESITLSPLPIDSVWDQIGFKKCPSFERDDLSEFLTQPHICETGYRTLLLQIIGNIGHRDPMKEHSAPAMSVQKNLRDIRAFPLMLSFTNHDDNNPFVREGAYWALRTAIDNSQENIDEIREILAEDKGIDSDVLLSLGIKL